MQAGRLWSFFYLNHRFSKDLDFFSAEYDNRKIKEVILKIEKELKLKIKKTDKMHSGNMARLKFCEIPVKGTDAILKVDFVEDVYFDNPKIKIFKGVPVYGLENIYSQKVYAIAGTNLETDEAGRGVVSGRNEARDIVDLYYISNKLEPISKFLKKMPEAQQRGMIKWYRSFSRQDFKLDYLNLEIYNKKLDSVTIIKYMDNEINKFIDEVLE